MLISTPHLGFITLFVRWRLVKRMADYTVLFELILAALTFVIIGMGFIVYLMLLSERGKKKLRAERVSASSKGTPDTCPHFFGYLFKYPTNQPVPDECFGCMKAIECIGGQGSDGRTAKFAEPVEQQR